MCISSFEFLITFQPISLNRLSRLWWWFIQIYSFTLKTSVSECSENDIWRSSSSVVFSSSLMCIIISFLQRQSSSLMRTLSLLFLCTKKNKKKKCSSTTCTRVYENGVTRLDLTQKMKRKIQRRSEKWRVK